MADGWLIGGVADWRASLLGKGLKVNAGKYKVMVGSSGGKMIVNAGKWPYGVCGKGVQTNSVQCTVCKKWIHKQCSGVRGDLSRVADGFRCRRCDGTIQEVDLAEDLMVDGETYDCVKSFCYLGDTLDGDGGAHLAATARIRNGWMKFRELLPFLTSRAPPLEMKGRMYASCVRSSMTLKKCMEYRAESRRPVGRPRKTWLVSVEADMAELEIDKEDVHDRSKWKRNVNVMKRKSNPIGKRTINR